MKRFAPPDAVAFLLLESAERPMNQTFLQLFRLPNGSGPEFVRETYEAMRACTDVAPMFVGHPATTRGRTRALRWSYDSDVDIDHHLRYMSLPPPSGHRELFELMSRLHGRAIDRHKPLWEVHVVDGLNDGCFAVITKVHHALFDGVFFLNLLQRSLSTDPHHNQVGVLWSQRPEALPDHHSDEVPGPAWRDKFGRAMRSVGELGPLVSVVRDALRERELFPMFRAPRTMFDDTGDVPWRCVAQSWSMRRIENVQVATGATVADVALAMCAGALRAFLAERNALPDVPLVAIVPFSLRTENDVEGRNLMSSGLCNLATHLEDPVKRLETIRASMLYNKQMIRKLHRQVAMLFAGLTGVPISGGSGLRALLPPQYNVGITCFADAKEPLYHNGARLENTYGFPPTLHGHALNIGIYSDAERMNFGIIGCARVLPDPETLLGHLETSLTDMERVVGL